MSLKDALLALFQQEEDLDSLSDEALMMKDASAKLQGAGDTTYNQELARRHAIEEGI